MSFLQPTMVVTLLASGMAAALLGSVKTPLAKRMQIDEARVGGLISLFGFTLVPVILVAGFLTDLVGRQTVLVGGSLLLAASLGLLATARSYLATLAAVVLLSGGWALVINVGNVLTPSAFPGATAYSTNLANVVFGAGAFLTPLVAAWLIRRFAFTRALAMLGAFAALPAVLALGVDFAALAPVEQPGQVVESAMSGLLGDPVLWLCGFALFFYGPLEASIGGWATTYLDEQGCRESTAVGLLSAFWLTFMASRLVAAFTVRPGAESAVILALSAACVAVMTAMVLARGPALAAVMVIAAGLIFGPIFPTLMAILLGHFDAARHGRAVGMLFAVGGIGWSVIPMLIGIRARRVGVRRALAIGIAAAVGLSAVALGLL